VLRALEKDPAQRYPNVGAFAVALGEFASGESLALVERVQATLDRAGVARSSPPSKEVSKPPSAVSATDTSWQTASRSTPSSRSVLLGAATVALLLLAAVALLLRKSPPVPASSLSTTAPSFASELASAPRAPAAAPVGVVVPTSPAPALAVDSPAVVAADPLPPTAPTHTAEGLRAPARHAYAAVPPSPLASSVAEPAAKHRNPLSIDFK
jgi:hypothetical protein